MAAAPAYAAKGGPLLSGYGGPGEGEQAILGSSLLGGPPGGGSDAGAGAGESLAAGAGSGGASGATVATGGSGSGAGSREPSSRAGSPGSGSRHGRGGAHMGVEDSKKRPERASAPTEGLADSAASQPLGLSNEDLVYIAIALAALALTGGLTLRLVRGPR